DASGRPVAFEAPGELLIGGLGLARGYRGRADLTAERFVPDPFGGQAGARLYRTGDLARGGLEGRLPFLVRLDQQVKLRGLRIEMGEMEAVLCEHPRVREDRPRDLRLAAYLKPASPWPPSLEELRVFLERRLPAYMVPSAFVWLEVFPLTPNGKIDRKKLPAVVSPRAEGQIIAARTPAEELIIGIFASVLQVEKVGAGDNFFTLGGHSLLATQLVSRVRDVFGVDLPLRRVFEMPTVAELAHAIETAADDASETMLPFERVPRDSPLALSLGQERLWFLCQLTPHSSAYNMANAVLLRGRLDVAALGWAFVAVAERHEILRAAISSQGGMLRLEIAPPNAQALPVLDLSALAADRRLKEARRLAVSESRRPFDLCRGPLLRIRVVKVEEESHGLLVTLHHMICDGWSQAVLVNELAAFYTARLMGQPAALPDLPFQYVDFAYWQRRRLTGDLLEREIGYWRRQLRDLPPTLQLPTDRPRPNETGTPKSGRATLSLTPDLSARLKQFGRSEGATLFMTLLAAYAVLFHRLSGQQETVVGTPIAGRDRRELENLIGFFLNTLALRIDLSGEPSFRALLKRVVAVALGSYAHQTVPFEVLVTELKPDRD